MRNPDVFPRKDIAFNTFQENLMKQLNKNRDEWGFSTEELNSLKAKQSVWVEAWAIASNRNARTTVQTNAKTTARIEYQKVLRPFIQMRIHHNTRMDDAALIACNIKPHDNTRKRIAAPKGTVAIQFSSMGNKIVKVWFYPALGQRGSNSRAMPKGVWGLHIVFKAGKKAPSGPDECSDNRLLTYSPYLLNFEKLKAGTTVYAYGCWINRKGEKGPWSEVLKFITV